MVAMENMVTIEGLTPKGYGYTQKLEIPKTLPQDEVVIERLKKGRARCLEVIKPSPLRVLPRCAHFPVCGGCKVQQMEMGAQLRWKEGKVVNAFSLCGTPRFLPIIASPGEYEWRNKMEFSFSEDKAGNRYLGLIMQEGKGKVFNVERCHLSNPWMSELLQEVRKWWAEENIPAYKPHRNSGTLRGLILREGITTKDRMVILHVSGNPEGALHQKQVESFKKAVLKFTPEEGYFSAFILIQQAIKGQRTEFYEIHLAGKDMIREKIGDKLFLISPRSFFQPNTLQAAHLYGRAIELLELKGEETVYDLYCGTGTLSILASPFAKRVIGVELSKEACLDANLNISINKITNVEIFNGDVAEVLQKGFPPADAVLVDPPRTGLSKGAIGEVCRLNPKKILYVSCNFQTCAIDVLEFIQAGYHLEVVQPIDQFPHTYHVESIALLTKE